MVPRIALRITFPRSALPGKLVRFQKSGRRDLKLWDGDFDTNRHAVAGRLGGGRDRDSTIGKRKNDGGAFGRCQDIKLGMPEPIGVDASNRRTACPGPTVAELLVKIPCGQASQQGI